MRFRFLALSLAVASWSFTQACGGDDSTNQDASPDVTSGNDTGTGNDSGNDTGTGNDSGNDTGTGNDSGNDTGTTDSGGGGLYRCGNGVDAGTVSDCSQCQGNPEPCLYCGNADASAHSGRCTTLGSSCLNGAPTGFGVCSCGTNTGDAAACPGAFQVCVDNQNNGFDCHTCGDNGGDNGLACKGGGTCNNADGGCK
jgi:hypothetical protein